MSDNIESNASKSRILVVDDDAAVRDVCSALLLKSGYLVDTARDGFSALLSMKYILPNLVLSDLNMPHMSGFEFLSVVRHRFPQILVIAMSGAYSCKEQVPAGSIADAFYPKGTGSTKTLLRMVEELLCASGERTPDDLRRSASVWIPRNGHDVRGRPFIVITCTECLRSFPINVAEEAVPEILLTPCLFCANEVRYIIDFSRSVASPEKTIARVAAEGGWPSVEGKAISIRPTLKRKKFPPGSERGRDGDISESTKKSLDHRFDEEALSRMDDEGGAAAHAKGRSRQR
jgi:CheY-like chemotaxis protein